VIDVRRAEVGEYDSDDSSQEVVYPASYVDLSPIHALNRSDAPAGETKRG